METSYHNFNNPTVFSQIFAPLEEILNAGKIPAVEQFSDLKLSFPAFLRNLIYEIRMKIKSISLLVTDIKLGAGFR